MTEKAQAELLEDVLSRYEGSPNPRVREICEAAIKHLHAFVSEVNLTRDEWFEGINFLTRAGQMCDDTRQEFILLSDTFGVSSLVEIINYDAAEGATENTVLGPFFVPGSPHRARGETMLVDSDEGDRVVIRGTITNDEGKPVAGAELDCWQNATHGFYAVQQPGIQSRGEPQGHLHDRRRRHLRDQHRSSGAVSDPVRRTGGRHAEGEQPPLDAPRPHPHVDPCRRVQGAHHPRVRRRERVPPRGSRVRRARQPHPQLRSPTRTASSPRPSTSSSIAPSRWFSWRFRVVKTRNAKSSAPTTISTCLIP